MSGNFTLFTNDSGAASGPLAYVQDVFNDVSLAPTNNTGLTSTSLTNPLGDFFNDNDSPKFGPKTLYVKDLVLVSDRSLWIQSKPTYRIIWNENAPYVTGYVAGNAFLETDALGNKYITLQNVNDLYGVTAIARRAAFIVNPCALSPSTVTVKVDGTGTATYDVGDVPAFVPSDNRGYKAHTVLAESANETIDLHDFRIIANTTNVAQSSSEPPIKVVGIIVYYENTSLNIQVGPGSSYVNKSKITTSTGATLALPSVGSTLGGRSVIYKTASSGYATASQAATQLSTIGVGSNAATSINVTTGTGASYPAGSIIAAFYGSTAYIGAVQSVSTDTLTVTPAVYPASGVSGPLYRLAFGGTNAVIGASLYDLAYSIGSTQFAGVTFGGYLDPLGNYLFQFGASHGVIGFTRRYGASYLPNFPPQSLPIVASVTGASSFIKVDGYFSAADIEVIGASTNGVGVYGGTFYINGIPTWSSVGTAFTGIIRFPIFTGAGPGWNSFQWGFGSSSGLNISKINLYTNKNPMGVSYGILGQLDTLQSFVDQNNNLIGATYNSWGNWRRIYGSNLPVRAGGSPTMNASYPQGTAQEFHGTGGFTLPFYGKNIALGGTFSSGTTVIIDGNGIPNASIWGRSYTALTEGFHTLQVSTSGSTTLIASVDISRTYGEVVNTQNPVSGAVTQTTALSPVSNIKNIVTAHQAGPTTVTGPAQVLCVAVTITTSGNPVLVTVSGTNDGTIQTSPSGSTSAAKMYIIRDDVVTLYQAVMTQLNSGTIYSQCAPSGTVIDTTVGPGTHTYKVYVNNAAGSGTTFADQIDITVWEMT